uniref:Uncharacterized protein n=1 Tax=Rhizophora mucronata TaxID=61149 RepID=A0A2P2PUP6_RHIMU
MNLKIKPNSKSPKKDSVEMEYYHTNKCDKCMLSTINFCLCEFQ